MLRVVHFAAFLLRRLVGGHLLQTLELLFELEDAGVGGSLVEQFFFFSC